MSVNAGHAIVRVRLIVTMATPNWLADVALPTETSPALVSRSRCPFSVAGGRHHATSDNTQKRSSAARYNSSEQVYGDGELTAR